jgi:stress response protein SCP2
VATIVKALERRFAKLPPLGRVFIDPSINGLCVPLSLRTASRSLRTVGRGSRLPLPAGDTIRLFMWWHDSDRRTDLDLCAVGFNAQCQPVGEVTYYDLRGLPDSAHSGDITSAPKGASEFIDLNRPALVEAGIRYVMMTVMSFTRQPFIELKGAFAGFMARESAQSGEIYEPKTVHTRFDLASASQLVTPIVLDLEENTAIWLDLAISHNELRERSVAANRASMQSLLWPAIARPMPDLMELFTTHAHARGTLVATREEADFVIGPWGNLDPFDVPTILSQYV